MLIRQHYKNILFVILGATILAFGTYNFNYQNNITEGGVLGLLLFFKNLFGISPSITSVIIDFSLFVLGSRFFGRQFLLYSFVSTTSFSLSYRLCEHIGFIVPNLSDFMLLGSLLAGVCVGVGVGLIVRAGGASGGDDVLALLLSRFTPLKMNWAYLLMDCFVLILSLLYLELTQIVYSLIAVTVSGRLISIFYYYKANTETESEAPEPMAPVTILPETQVPEAVVPTTSPTLEV